MGREYTVSAAKLEGLLQVLKPLGKTIQYSALEHQPVQFGKDSLVEFGTAVQEVENQVSKQRAPLDLFK